ncbi:MAG: hypothetical protein R2712_24710 [Vicinamibacterales bacterium]
MRYTHGPLEVGASGTAVARQSRASSSRRPKRPGHGLLRLHATFTRQTGGSLQTITARLDNATNTLYRNHLNFLKDVVPEMGRAFRPVHLHCSDRRRTDHGWLVRPYGARATLSRV